MILPLVLLLSFLFWKQGDQNWISKSSILKLHLHWAEHDQFGAEDPVPTHTHAGILLKRSSSLAPWVQEVHSLLCTFQSQAPNVVDSSGEVYSRCTPDPNENAAEKKTPKHSAHPDFYSNYQQDPTSFLGYFGIASLKGRQNWCLFFVRFQTNISPWEDYPPSENGCPLFLKKHSFTYYIVFPYLSVLCCK